MSRVFYGWIVLAGLCVTYAVSNGILLGALPAFYPSLINEFGWDAKAVTLPATISFVATAILSLFVGYFIDRFSPRPMMIIGSVLYVVVLLAYRYISTLDQMIMIHVGFSCALALNGILPSMVVTSRWFKKYRGVAVGLLLMASSLGGAFLPLVVSPILTDEGWRTALITIAAIGFVMMVLPCVFILRNDPSEKNTVPDGVSDGSESGSEPAAQGVMAGATLGEAMKMPIFYLLAFATAVMWFCISGVVQHQSVYLVSDLGLPLEFFAGRVLVVFFLSSVIGKILFGILSDYFSKVNIMLVATANLTLGLLILRLIDGQSISVVLSYAVIYGIGFSGAFTMIQLMIAELFAGPTYGKILGVYVFIDTLAGAAGIGGLGIMRDAMGSYDPAINMMIGLCVAAFVCVYIIKRQVESQQPVAAE